MATLIVIDDICWTGGVNRGGIAMHVLQWLHGLERLGHEVLFIDRLNYDPRVTSLPTLDRFKEIVSRWWHPDQTALILHSTQESLYGLSIEQIAEFTSRAAALITLAVPGTRIPFPLTEKVRPRIFIEQDPGFSHLWAVAKSPADVFGEHCIYFTVGANIGTPRCEVPTSEIFWRATWNPTVIDWWSPEASIERDRFTTISDWWAHGYVDYQGETLGPKAEEFRKFIELPEVANETLEIVLDIKPDSPDIDLLETHGWKLEPPDRVSTPNQYREYIISSLGEFSCAKGGYVGTQCGWFSERSAAYLAAGRPVVLQGTGFADVLPTGRGLFSVNTVDEAKEAIGAIRLDYAFHSDAARAISQEYFDSDKVLSRLLREAGIPSKLYTKSS